MLVDVWNWLHAGDFTEDVSECCDFQAAVINRPHVMQVQFFTRADAVDNTTYLSRDHHLGLIKFYPDWAVLTVDSERLESRWVRVRRTFYKIETLPRLLSILNGTRWGEGGADNDDELCEVDRMEWGGLTP